MKSLAPTFDDIIFEGRNKAYGAYELRQLSDRHNAYGLLISGSALILMLVLACLLSGNYGTTPVMHEPIVASPANIPPIAPELPKTIPAPQPPAVNTKAFLEMNPVHTVPVLETDIPSQAELVEPVVSTETVETITPTVTVVSPTLETGPSVHTATAPVTTKPMDWAPVMPSFIGGEKALRKYLATHIKMHPIDIENGVSGKLWIRFFVDIDGSIKNATVIKDTAGGHCAEVALNVISKMPKWNPGMQNNIPVRVYYNIPIVFEVK